MHILLSHHPEISSSHQQRRHCKVHRSCTMSAHSVLCFASQKNCTNTMCTCTLTHTQEVSQTGRLEDATPVALLGTAAMGWVQRMSCRAPSPDAIQSAMMAAWQRIAAGNPGNTDAEQTCVRGLKMALELLNSTTQPPPAPYHNPPLLAARPLTQVRSYAELTVQARSLNTYNLRTTGICSPPCWYA